MWTPHEGVAQHHVAPALTYEKFTCIQRTVDRVDLIPGPDDLQ